MKNKSKSGTLLKELARDPRLKRVIAKARKESRGAERAKVETATDLFLLALTIGSRFSKKKRARAMDELGDLVYLLVQASLLLKENIFERHEVKEFFSKISRQLYSWVSRCMAMILPESAERPPGAATSRKRVGAYSYQLGSRI